MAKGNMFLGTAQKKVGDVVLYRRDGVQQSRVRVRKIANPKTEGQALQRCFLAPVAKFYAPLAGVLERAWENQNKSKSAQSFQRVNINKAKAEGWYVQKGVGFFPLPYQLSYGILPRLKYTIAATVATLDAGTPAGTTIGALSAALIARYGLAEGDQLTFVGVTFNAETGTYRPLWLRFLLNSSDTRAGSALSSEVVIDIRTSGVYVSSATAQPLVAVAFIVSRYDNGWKRSTQSLAVVDSVLSQVMGEDARAAAIASYQDGASVVTSDVYLNGSVGSPRRENLAGGFYKLWQRVSASSVVATDLSVKPLSVSTGDVAGGSRYIVNCVSDEGEAFAEVVIVYFSSVSGTIRVLSSTGDWTAADESSLFYCFNVLDISSELVQWLIAHGIPSSAFA